MNDAIFSIFFGSRNHMGWVFSRSEVKIENLVQALLKWNGSVYGIETIIPVMGRKCDLK